MSGQTIRAAVNAMRSGKLDPLTYLESFIAATKQHAELNAYISFDEADLRKRAEAIAHGAGLKNEHTPLYAVPVAVKDNIDAAGFRTTGGTPGLKSNMVETDSGAVAKLRRAGAIVSGKTNLHELAFGITSNNAAFGPVHNPHDKSLIAGGSSSGSAVAVASGMAAFALGTDTGGSCRIPAALCGCVGFRPTIGRYPGNGVINLSKTRDTVGVLAASVNDTAYVDGVLAGMEAAAPQTDPRQVRLGVPRTSLWSDLDAETRTVAEGALDRIARAGVMLVDVDMAPILDLNAQVGFPIVLYEAVRDLAEYLGTLGRPKDIEELARQVASPDVHGILGSILGDGAISEDSYNAALTVHRPALIRAYRKMFTDNGLDGLIFPTTPLPARPIGEDETVRLNGREVPTFGTYLRNVDPISNAGMPGISLPCGNTSAGLPVGIEIDSLDGQDRRLLSMAESVERVLLG